MDTESVLVKGESNTPLRYGVFSTFKGTTAVFDLHRLNGGQPRYNESPFAALPAPFRRWMEDDAVVVIGADVQGDAGVAGAHVSASVDCRRIFEHLQRPHPSGDEPPVIHIQGIGNKTGLGVQAYWAKGVDFKPQQEATYVRLYGPHRYFYRESLRWPWWRDPLRLYAWARGPAGILTDQHEYYLWNDGTTPMALVTRILLTNLLRHPTEELSGGRFLPDRIQSLLRPYVVSRAPLLGRNHLLEPLDISSDESDPGPPVHRVPVPRDWRPRSPTPPVPQEVPQAAQEVRPAQQEEEETPLVWGPTQEAKLAWMTTFNPGPRCVYCASGRHRLRANSGHIVCPRYLAGEVYKCEYPYCEDKEPHCTAMCATLHGTCLTCYTKGHTFVQRCEEWTEEDWKTRRDTWEQHADRGIYSRRRQERWELGFFSHRKFSAWPWPFSSYTHMLSVPVTTVLDILSDWAKGIAPLPPWRPRPAQHDEPRPRNRKRPPPEDTQYVPAPAVPTVGRQIAEEFHAGRLQPLPASKTNVSTLAASLRRPQDSVFRRLDGAPRVTIRPVQRQVQVLPQPQPPKARKILQAVIRPARPSRAPLATSTPRRPSSTATSASAASLPDMSVPPPRLPPPPSRRTSTRPPLLALPRSPSPSDTVDLDLPAEDRLDQS